jgi:hypothetical protein
MNRYQQSNNWYWNLLALIIIGLFIYYYLYPRYKNRDIIKAQKEAREKKVINNLYQIYQQYNGNQEEIITVPEPEVKDLNYMIDSYNPHPTLPKEMIEKHQNKKSDSEERYFENNDPLREVAIYSDFVLRNGEYPPSNSNDGTLSGLI